LLRSFPPLRSTALYTPTTEELPWHARVLEELEERKTTIVKLRALWGFEPADAFLERP